MIPEDIDVGGVRLSSFEVSVRFTTSTLTGMGVRVDVVAPIELVPSEQVVSYLSLGLRNKLPR